MHQNISDVQNTQTCRILVVGEVEVRLQTLQTGRRDVVAVEVIHDVDQNEQTASSIKLALQALLDDDPTSWIDVRKHILLFSHVLEVHGSLFLELGESIIVVS